MIEPQLAALLDALPAVVLVWGPDRRLLRVSALAAGLAEPPLAPGQGVLEVAVALGADAARLLPPAVWAGEVAPLELVLQRRVLEGRVVPVRAASGEVELAVVLLEDVTEARRSDELRAGEARVLERVAAEEPLPRVLDALARIFEAQAEGMQASVLLIEDGRVRHVAAPSLPAAWSRAVDGEPIGPDRGSCGTAAHLKQPVIVTDIAADPRWALYREPALAFGLRACWSVPVLGADGAVLGTFAFYYSRPRAPTPRLLELATRASGLAAVAIQHDRRAKEVAGAAARAKSAFLATMSHEIRTPLNAILGYTQLLQGDAALGPTQREKVEVIRASGDHLLGLLGNVLEMSKLEAGRTALVLAPFDLHRLLSELEALFAPLAAARGLDVAFERAADLPRELVGDAGKVRQVLLNLLSNALKFTARGGIRVRAAVRDEGPRARVTVRVEDTGAGIEPEVLPRIFDAFVKTPLGERAGGSGLGLTISRSFAQLMGGSLSVQSAVGQGSAFTFELVAERQTQAADRPPAPLGPADGARSRGGTARLTAAAELAPLLAALPAPLREELREAASRARPGRVLEVARRVAEVSPGAAERIRALADQLRYDRLLAALDGRST